MMFLAQLREDEYYSLCVKPNKRSSGSFSVSIRCMHGMWKSYYVAAKMRQPMHVVSNWNRHTKLCFTKTRSAERLTQLAIHKCLPRSSHRSAMNSTANAQMMGFLWCSVMVNIVVNGSTLALLITRSIKKASGFVKVFMNNNNGSYSYLFEN